jgi:hypothetical protein
LRNLAGHLGRLADLAPLNWDNRPVRASEPRAGRHWWQRRFGRQLTADASAVLATPVQVAVPLQRHRPAVVLAVSVAELLALLSAILLPSSVGLLALVLLACLLVAMGATNRHRTLAVTANGVVVLTASARGRPRGVVGPAPADLTLPAPAGFGAPVLLDDQTWWVERAAYPRLTRARLLAPGADDAPTGGG